MNLWKECKGLQDYIVGIRRTLHQIPELGTDLPKTQATMEIGRASCRERV